MKPGSHRRIETQRANWPERLSHFATGNRREGDARLIPHGSGGNVAREGPGTTRRALQGNKVARNLLKINAIICCYMAPRRAALSVHDTL